MFEHSPLHFYISNFGNDIHGLQAVELPEALKQMKNSKLAGPYQTERMEKI